MTNIRTVLTISAYAVGALLILQILKKNGINVTQAVTAAAVDAVGDVGSGVVLGVGDAIRLPRTNETECEKAMREGRTWDASFACPAGTFLSYLTGSSPKPASSSGALPSPNLTSQNPAGINFNWF